MFVIDLDESKRDDIKDSPFALNNSVTGTRRLATSCSSGELPPDSAFVDLVAFVDFIESTAFVCDILIRKDIFFVRLIEKYGRCCCRAAG